MSDVDTKRLLLRFEQAVRSINRAEINPKISELKVSDINPVIKMVAQSRAQYLQALFDLAKLSDDQHPKPDQIKSLKIMRESYEELMNGSKALEVAIERGYLDVQS